MTYAQPKARCNSGRKSDATIPLPLHSRKGKTVQTGNIGGCQGLVEQERLTRMGTGGEFLSAGNFGLILTIAIATQTCAYVGPCRMLH